MNIAVSSIIEEEVSVGDGSFIWYFSHICEGARIGRDVNVGEKSYIGKKVIIGDNVKIGNNVNIYEGTIIRNNVFIGNGVCFTNVRNPKAKKKSNSFLDTIVEEGVTIGANATIVGGVKIGKNSIIADGSVVFFNIPENVFAAGNPAQIKKEIK